MLEHGNIYACLVHERQDCVLDLVRNLHFLDPDSLILLYNGGRDSRLMAGLSFEQYGAVVHPRPQPVPWGRLHPFALDCMRFALDHYPFRTLTIVDSDQLASRPGYSARLSAFMSGRSGVGMLGNAPGVQAPGTSISPAQTALKEIDLWRPFLRRFPRGEQQYVHWTFWPSTVFTAEAARLLTQLFATDRMLQRILTRSKIWATEEILFPTLTALLGLEVLASPFSYDYVQFRKPYTIQQIKDAQARSDVFWLHPILRQYNDPLRNTVRASFGNYERAPLQQEKAMTTPQPQSSSEEGLLLVWPILERMKHIEGWLAEDEADLLLAATALALVRVPQAEAIVEVGSYCGRSTCVLGSAVKAIRPSARVYAIDPHDGKVGAADQSIKVMPPTLEKLNRNLHSAGVSSYVNVVVAASWEVTWNQPTSLVFIDGLHDYVNVSRDFRHFEPSLVVGGFAAFHDYADYYPGVRTFVDELVKSGRYEKVRRAGSMMVLKKLADDTKLNRADPQPATTTDRQPERVVALHNTSASPLVSCIMPTADRRTLVPQAIRYFQRQDYPNRELIVVDSGREPIADLLPEDPGIQYIRASGPLSLGALRNLACEHARGEIIAHWDDDDWMSPHRISYQVEELAKASRKSVCGLSRLFYFDPGQRRAWIYKYPERQKPWLAGGTFCYRKDLWLQHRFPDVTEGEDTRFVWSLPQSSILPLEDCSFYVATVHARNSSPKRTQDTRWLPRSLDEITGLIGGDLPFYEKWPAMPSHTTA